jgi:tetratricopeptide (TPR) repeat protein
LLLPSLLDVARLAWPLLLAFLLLKLRWLSLARAAAITCLVLAAETFLSMILERGLGISFDESGMIVRLSHQTLPTIALWVGLGSLRMLFELALAWKAYQVGRERFLLPSFQPERASSRLAVFSRLAALASVGFALMIFGVKIWDGYLYLLSTDDSLRKAILRADRGGGSRRPIPERPEDKFLREAGEHINRAIMLNESGQYREAARAYGRGITIYEHVLEQHGRRRFLRSDLAMATNNLAWLLATCPQESVRNPARAVSLAQRTVSLAPGDGNDWNTLGVALYRNDDLSAADDALARATELRGGGDSFDWFFQAMIRWRQGDRDAALGLYEKAAHWREQQAPMNRELHRFQVETAVLLGQPVPEPLPATKLGRRPLGSVRMMPKFGRQRATAANPSR